MGHREFWHLDFEVSPAVLIPRPETELIVEAALELLPGDASFEVCDVGTGSGCLAVAIAKSRPSVHVTATDVSATALETAARNARRHHVASRVRLVSADLFGEGGPFDMIVSNPPYVPDAECAGLQPEVRYEPAGALFGGPDGLRIIRRLIVDASSRLKPAGWLIFEIGIGQADAVGALISSASSLTMTEIRHDLQGIARAVVVRKS